MSAARAGEEAWGRRALGRTEAGRVRSEVGVRKDRLCRSWSKKVKLRVQVGLGRQEGWRVFYSAEGFMCGTSLLCEGFRL